MALRVLLPLLALLAVVSADGFYAKNSPVLQVTGKTYDSLIAQSNHTSILEFYAPWCGHCQNLKPAYEKAAKSLTGLAKVAAINCDEESNKPFCGRMEVQGFPTLKIVRPGSKPGKPIVEDYQGARSAKGIVDAVVDKIPNHVKRVQNSELDKWLSGNPEAPKALLFSEKGTTSPLIRSLAVDFLGVMDFAQIRSKETPAVRKYGITQFPTLVVLSGPGKEPLLYTAEMKRTPILAFINQVAAPNPDPAPKQTRSSKTAKSSESAAASQFSQASAAHKSADLYEDLGDAGTIVLDDQLPTYSPLPIVPPKQTPITVPQVISAIPLLATSEELKIACLSLKTARTCILLLLPSKGPEEALSQSATDALTSSAQIADKHAKRKSKIPFYGIPSDNAEARILRGDLGLRDESQLEIVALNRKRMWYRVHAGSYGVTELENWVDEIRLGEGSKQTLPEGFYAETTMEEQLPHAKPTQEPVETVVGAEGPVTTPAVEPISSVEHKEL